MTDYGFIHFFILALILFFALDTVKRKVHAIVFFGIIVMFITNLSAFTFTGSQEDNALFICIGLGIISVTELFRKYKYRELDSD